MKLVVVPPVSVAFRPAAMLATGLPLPLAGCVGYHTISLQ